jgi:beta-glucosidase
MEQVVAAAPGKPVVLVLMSGSAVSVNWADATVPAILQAWYGGQAAGTAIADVLFGKVSPGGRLPITVYRSVDQLPPFESYAMKGRTYRYFTGAPLYPFGHGLSYARFTYANLVVPVNAVAGSPLRVSVEVRNAGTMAADEVVQLYVLPRDPASTAAARALRGFQRLTLRPGDTRAVTFTLDERAFSSVRDDGQRVVGPGRFTIAVGGKQPGLRGTADADTTMVLSKDIELTGAVKALAP